MIRLISNTATLRIADEVQSSYKKGPLHWQKEVPEEYKSLRFLKLDETKEKGNVVAKQALYNYKILRSITKDSLRAFGVRAITEGECVSLRKLYTSDDEVHVVKSKKEHCADVIHMRWILGSMMKLYATKANRKAKCHIYFRYGKWKNAPMWTGERGRTAKIIFTVPKNPITAALIKPFETHEQPNGVWFNDLLSLHNLVTHGLCTLDEAVILLDKGWGL